MNTSSRGQAAIEFLITYGWAILGVLIVIGALAYFGVFNTTRYVDDVCYYGEQIRCEDYALSTDGLVQIQFRNNFPVAINVSQVIVSSEYGVVTCDADGFSPNINIAPSGTFIMACDATTQTLPADSRLKIKSIVTFQRNETGSPPHNVTGDMYLTAARQ